LLHEIPRQRVIAGNRPPKLDEERAVVCDLCHTLPGGPACVTACPHEAALRIHAPTGRTFRRPPS
jgi:Fe-S-cluster-containing hydrogenase component 2